MEVNAARTMGINHASNLVIDGAVFHPDLVPRRRIIGQGSRREPSHHFSSFTTRLGSSGMRASFSLLALADTALLSCSHIQAMARQTCSLTNYAAPIR